MLDERPNAVTIYMPLVYILITGEMASIFNPYPLHQSLRQSNFGNFSNVPYDLSFEYRLNSMLALMHTYFVRCYKRHIELQRLLSLMEI